MWPSLRVELVLSVVVYLQVCPSVTQMFKYAFDYCSIVWNAPYGINETLFFSYLDIAHYERYLPEAVFVNLLYIVMGYPPANPGSSASTWCASRTCCGLYSMEASIPSSRR